MLDLKGLVLDLDTLQRPFAEERLSRRRQIPSLTDITSNDLIYKVGVPIDSSTNGNSGFIFRVPNFKAGSDSTNGYYAGIGNGFIVLGHADNNWNGLETIRAADIEVGQSHHLMI
ncbi:hypothetical protein N7527_005574 [Penicillium freii]|nr:hypothetical protein N7527_005574 [Penicillium freii]